MRLRAQGLGAFAAVLLAGSLALAQGTSSADTRRARALFEEGVALSDEGKWSDALVAFQKADEIATSPNLRYNIGSTLRALGRYVEARKVLQKVLDDAPRSRIPLKPSMKADVEKLLAEVSAKIVVITLKVDPPNADVQMDGNPVGALDGGRLEVDPGKHVFVVSADGYETVTQTGSVAYPGGDVVLTATKIIPKVEVVKETPFYARAWFIATASVIVGGAATVAIIVAAQPRTPPPAGPPQNTANFVVPAGFRF